MGAAKATKAGERLGHGAALGLRLVAGVVLASQSVSVGAQIAPEATGGTLAEVVVTARRMEESLQKTPVAVTALTMDDLQARSAQDLRDLARFTPNVYMSNALLHSPDTITMYIRGVGLSDFYTTNDPGVGLYIDGVYYARSQGAILDLLDLERVEVLRGPQGTLFGKNTAGGAINLISRHPGPEVGGSLSLTAGNIGQWEARGSVSVPIADDLALGLSALTRNRDCLSRRERDGGCVGSIERRGGRAYLRWTPNSDLTVNLIGDVTAGRSHVIPSHPVGYDPEQSFFKIYNDLVAAGLVEGGLPYTLASPGVNPARYEVTGRAPVEDPIDSYGVSLGLDYEIGDATLHSITAYRDVTALTFANNAGDTGGAYDPQSVYINTESHWFTQEFRIDGSLFDDRLDYIGGLYYFNEVGVTNEAVPFFAPLQAGWVNFNTQETDSYAAFVHGSYAITDRLNVSAGIRYTRETKEWSGKYAHFASFASDSFDPNTQALELVLGNGDDIPNDLNEGPASTARVQRRDTWSPITPKIGVDFQATPDLLIFANVARGSRSGGFNGRANALVATTPFDPEYALTYEIGEKAEFLNHHLRINATAFFTDYEDLQQTVLTCIREPNGECRIDVGEFVYAPIVANAAAARIYGGELEAVALGPNGRLRVEAMLGYLNGSFTSVDPEATAATGLTTDSVMPFIPEWTGALAAQYTWNVGFGSLTPRVDYSYRSRVAFNINPGPWGQQGAIGLFNATLTLADAKDRWSAQLYGRNLTDKDYVLLYDEYRPVVGGPGGVATMADPREYGVTVTMRF
jgi:iron complex outermembrane receptor protein